MNLVFPFRNLALHKLIDFLSKEKLIDIIEENMEEQTFRKMYSPEFFQRDIILFRDSLPDFENEALQIIYTTDQKTIDTYFMELQNSLDYINEMFSKEFVKSKIIEWKQEDEKNPKEQKESLWATVLPIDLNRTDNFHSFLK